MRKVLIAVVGLAAIAALPATALAGIVGTVHDLPALYTYTGTAAKMGTCSFCHIPHKAASGGQKLFPETYTTGLPAAWSSDGLSNICWYCHGAASGYTRAREVMPFQSTAHRRNTSILSTAGGINGGGTATETDIASVPTDMDLTGSSLRCTSCHSIHDATRRPFLRWGTGNGALDLSAAAAGFCGKCHSGRDNAATFGSANTGMHPSRTAYADAAGSGSPLNGTTTLPTIFQINPVADLGGTAQLTGYWNLGGHAQWTAATTESNTFACGTCHAVHGNETTDYTAADGSTQVTTATAFPGNDLLVLKDTADSSGDSLEDVCEGCHSIVIGKGVRGPGGAGTYSHPVGTDSPLAESMRANSLGYRWNPASTNSTILCQSCHDMHFSGLNHGTSATGSYLQAYQCDECHTNSTDPGVHHVTGIANANTLVKGTAETSTATDWSARSQTTGGVGNYWQASLGGTTLTCKTCHSGGAHNKANSTMLTGVNVESDMCVDCHGFNPSVYTTTSTLGTASHFVGAITDTVYKVTSTLVAGYADNAPRYSGDGTNGSMICESCHTIRINGVNGHVVSYQWSNNVNDTLASTKDSIRNVLLVSGNSDAYTTSDQNLCTACHGGTPGGGQSHPVLPSYLGGSLTPTGEATTVSGHSAGQINCESCHRPHDADTDSLSSDWSNAWILEAASNPGTYIDYAPLCDNCHPAQY